MSHLPLIYFIVLSLINLVKLDKPDGIFLKEYSPFLNYGDKKLSKYNKTKLENSLLKSKVDVLGGVFRKSIDEVKTTSVMDLVFLIDASSSVGEDNFQSEIKFVKKFLSDVTVDYNHTRVAIITYSSSNNVFKNVDEITEPEEENNKCLLLNKQLNTIRYTGGGTYTLGAFKLAKHIFNKSRKESKKVLFLITDGFSNGGDPVPVAHELKEKGVVIFTLGVQNGNYKELYELASSPGEMHSFLLDSFQEFESLARRALHVDLQNGDYIPLGKSTLCDSLCEGGNCCDDLAICACGTSTGHYSCVCQPGYYGSGLKKSCSPCPSGSYASGSNLCLPCPDINHYTNPPAIGIGSCKCKNGYQLTPDHQCEVIKCPPLTPPENGYFVKKKGCNNVLFSACGVRCDVGYTLSGSSIRMCQQNGQWSGAEPSCQVRTCNKISTPLHGFMKCEHPDLGKTYDEGEEMPIDTVCKFKCGNGRSLIGSSQRTCLPIAQWDGLRASCRQIKCIRLPKMPYLKMEPKSCAMGKQPLGKICKFSCPDGFRLSGPKEKECSGDQGRWTNFTQYTSCEDITPPELVCPKNMKNSTQPGKNFGSVSWAIPNITDNSGLEVSMWTKPAIKNIGEFKFKIGKTTVTYFAQDVFKNTAKCSFTVEIEDEEKPTIEECVSPPSFLSSDVKGANVSWDEPNIFDNSQTVEITKSHTFGFFKTGTTEVTYTAVDLSNNTETCSINITVQATLCEELPAPMNGQSDCKPSPGVNNCVITCQDGYALPLSAQMSNIETDNETINFICNDSEPLWYSPEGQLFPECTVVSIPIEETQEGELTIPLDETEDVCRDPSSLKEFQNELKNDLLSNVFDEDCNGSNCNLNAVAQCEDDLESEEEKTNIIKRDTAHQQKQIVKNKQNKIKKKKKIVVKFEVKKKINKSSAKSNQKPMDLRRKIRRMKYMEGKNITTAYAFKFKDPSVVCPLGFATKKTKCVQCPPGTFHNVTRHLCQSCPIGTYNNKHGETECHQCPPLHSTRRVGAKLRPDCVEQCSPGTFARKKLIRKSKHSNQMSERITLKPYCRSCPIGFYQSEYGKLNCLRCPKGYNTTNRGAKSKDQCLPTVQELCLTNICNNGYCVIENDYYSCSCHDNFIGTHCEINLNGCTSNPCQNGGYCKLYPSEFSTDYVCLCKEGFSGRYCEEEVDKCSLKCVNNGTCVQDEEENTQICICPKGFGGALCEIKVQYCKQNLCENNGRCIEQPDGFKCICKNGYMGRRCHILPCDYQPCQGNSSCLNLIQPFITRDSYKCECPLGYAGVDCSIKISYCKINPCLNGGICESLESSYVCKCPKIYNGKNCENVLYGNYILNFPKSGTTDFIRMDGFNNDISQISVCLWLQTKDNFNYGTILSYATKEFDNTFTLTDYTGLVIYINNKNIITDVYLNDGHWHFFCVTWNGEKGLYNLYLDGKRVRNGTDFLQGSKIKGGGKFVVGQEQDILGGKFSQSESFLGKMAHLDVWSRVLSEKEINYYMLTCTDNIFGDLFAWHEFRLHINGDVEVLPTTFCKYCEEPQSIQNGAVNVYENIAFYKCQKGYQIVNPYSNGRKCNKAAKWEGQKEPFCKSVYCGPPGHFKNGYILGRRYSYGDQIIYRCNTGYNMSGLSIRYCSETGHWMPEEPRCIGSQCDAFPKPKYSQIKVLPDDTYEEYLEELNDFDLGTILEISCEEGAQLFGAKILTCRRDGTWSFPIPTCVKEPTIPVTIPSNILDKDKEKQLNSSTVLVVPIINEDKKSSYETEATTLSVEAPKTVDQSTTPWYKLTTKFTTVEPETTSQKAPIILENTTLSILQAISTTSSTLKPLLTPTTTKIIPTQSSTSTTTKVTTKSPLTLATKKMFSTKINVFETSSKLPISTPTPRVSTTKISTTVPTTISSTKQTTSTTQSTSTTISSTTKTTTEATTTTITPTTTIKQTSITIPTTTIKQTSIAPTTTPGTTTRQPTTTTLYTTQKQTSATTKLTTAPTTSKTTTKAFIIKSTTPSTTISTTVEPTISISMQMSTTKMMLTTTTEAPISSIHTLEKPTEKESLNSCHIGKLPAAPLNGYIVEDSLNAFKNGSSNTVQYKCRFGHTQKGINVTTCLNDGQWSALDISCDLVPCPEPTKIKHMDIKYGNISSIGYYFGNMVLYECVEGYKFYGNNAIRCSAAGKWTRMQGRCTRKSCYRPIVEDDTIIEGTSYLYQDTVTLICPNNARYVLVCGKEGKWLGDKGKDC